MVLDQAGIFFGARRSLVSPTLTDVRIVGALLAIAVAALLALDWMRERDLKRVKQRLREAEARNDKRLRLLEQDAFGDSWQGRQ